jgi:DNA polymerase III delta prime subunit
MVWSNKVCNFTLQPYLLRIKRGNLMEKTDIWCFKHEPQTLDDMVLDPTIKNKLAKTFNEMPNLCFIGPAGVGKGTFTHIFLKKTGVDNIWINCSDETSIDNIRTKVKSFATALGITPIKYVVLNEIDYLSIPAQAMLRDLTEQVQSITRFIAMANYGHKIIPELLSRCQVIELNAPPVTDIGKFVMGILKKENVKIGSLSAVSDTIKKLYPDIRRIINTLQLNTIGGKLSSVTIDSATGIYEKILVFALDGDLDAIRKTVRSNTVNYTDLYSYMYENIDRFKNPGDAILTISEYLYRDAIISIREINLMSCILKLMKSGCI